MKQQEIKLMHRLFVDAYANPNSKTYGNALRSYLQAGYKEGSSNSQCASRLLHSAKIQAMIQQYQPPEPQEVSKRVEITKSYALQKLQSTFEKAEKQGDITNMVACVRLMMQKNGMLTDKLVVSTQDAIQLDESHQRQYKVIASIILQNKDLVNGDVLPEQSATALPAPEPVDAEFEVADASPAIE
jgi:hypothetical protein